MADIPVDGKTRVAFVPSISNQAAPTVAELNAGLLLQSVITPDGLMGFEADTATVDTSALDSTFDTTTIGRDSFSGTKLRLKKQTGTDTAWDTLVRGATGFLAVRRYIDSATGWSAGQKTNIYPIICGTAKELAPEKNTVSRYEVPTFVNAAATLRATVA